MIDLEKLRESEGYMLAIVNTKTGKYAPEYGKAVRWNCPLWAVRKEE